MFGLLLCTLRDNHNLVNISLKLRDFSLKLRDFGNVPTTELGETVGQTNPHRSAIMKLHEHL
jgi:hypothetical protein